MRFLTLLIQIAGVLLLVIAAVPLLQFIETVDGLQITTQVSDNTLLFVFDYNVSAPLKNYTISIYSSGELVGSADGEILNQGDVVEVGVPLDRFDPGNYTIHIEGSVYGLYKVSVNLTKTA